MEEKDLEKQVLEEIDAQPVEEAKEENETEVLEASERKVVVRLNVDYRTLKYYNVYVLKYVRKFYLIYALFIALLLGGVVYSIIAQSYIITALMGVFALYMVYQMFTIDKTVDRQLTGHFLRRRPQVQEYTFTDEGIKITPTDGGDPIDYEWIYVTSIHQTPQFYYLYLGKQPVIVDRREEMIIEGTKEDLEGIIASQAEKKPFKIINKEILKEPVEFNYPDYDAMEEAQRQAEEENKANEVEAIEENTSEDHKNQEATEETEDNTEEDSEK